MELYQSLTTVSGPEFKELARWAFGGMLVGGQPMSEEEIEAMTEKMVASIDTDADGKIDFPEFEKFFNDRVKRLAEIEAALMKLREAAKPPPMPQIPPTEEVLSAVRKKWIELDVDKSDTLEGVLTCAGSSVGIDVCAVQVTSWISCLNSSRSC